MGCCDGTEVCELVSCYILNQLSIIIRKEFVGLYHENGLGIFKNIYDPEIERKCKYIVNVFKNCNIKITIKTNLASVGFLDFSLNLNENTYEPFRKPNSNRIYHQQTFKPSSFQNQFVKGFWAHHITEMYLKKLCKHMKLS